MRIFQVFSLQFYVANWGRCFFIADGSFVAAELKRVFLQYYEVRILILYEVFSTWNLFQINEESSKAFDLFFWRSPVRIWVVTTDLFEIFRNSCQTFQSNIGIVPQIWTWPLTYTSFQLIFH